MAPLVHSRPMVTIDLGQPQETIAHGEAFLTIGQFKALLDEQGHLFSKSTIYRWRKVTKEFLPSTIKNMLAPAPSIWFLTMSTNRDSEGATTIIPLRYLNEAVRPTAQKYCLNYASPSPMNLCLHTLRTYLSQAQKELDRLTHFCDGLEGKDLSNAEHRTRCHPPSA